MSEKKDVINKNDNEFYCTLRVPNETRDLIIKIAEKERFNPKWPAVANQFLLQGIKKYHSENTAYFDKAENG